MVNHGKSWLTFCIPRNGTNIPRQYLIDFLVSLIKNDSLVITIPLKYEELLFVLKRSIIVLMP